MQIENVPRPSADILRDLSPTLVFGLDLFPFYFNDFEYEVVLHPIFLTCYDINLATILKDFDSDILYQFFPYKG